MRHLLILEEVARVGIPMTPTEINRKIGLPKQTLHRLFTNLEEDGFLQREHDGRSYSPGPRLRAMATGVMSSTRVRAARLAVMKALSKDIGETCNLVLPGRHAMIYLDRVETDWPLRVQLPIGTEVPLHCTASGKLYLSTLSKARLQRILNAGGFEKKTERTLTDPAELSAELDRVRRKGYAQDNEEFIDGMVALAAPVKDAAGRMVCSLAFHAPTPRMTLSVAHTHLNRLRAAADELSRIIVEDDGAHN
ncbi:MAG: IclR family transcriptional regulator [Alphaproteobacteria bacterium]|nr:IclR family transcriptional regulator [Alphaproteobacteria bacterium]